MNFFPNNSMAEPEQLKGSTLLLPAVTAGNVGELCADALISTLTDANMCISVGWLEEDSVMPVVGYTDPGVVATPLELYHITGTKVFILQQRGPARKGCQQVFAEHLSAWCTRVGVVQMVVLCGLDAALCKDVTQAQGVRYWMDNQQDQVCSSLGWSVLEPELMQEEREVHHLLPPWSIMDAVKAALSSTLLICTFVLEGDNRSHAIQLAGQVLAWLRVKIPLTTPDTSLSVPASWAAACT